MANVGADGVLVMPPFYFKKRMTVSNNLNIVSMEFYRKKKLVLNMNYSSLLNHNNYLTLYTVFTPLWGDKNVQIQY